MKTFKAAASILLLSSATAFAADLPSHKAPVEAPPPAPIWTGFYAGLNAGGTWSNNSTNISTTPIYINPILSTFSGPVAAMVASGALNSNAGGFIGGGQVGYNYQFMSMFIAGIEADIQGIAGSSAAQGAITAAIIPYGNPNDTWANYKGVINTLNYLGTVRGRIGFLVTPSILIFGSGGLAYGDVNSQANLTWTGAPVINFSSGGSTFFGQGSYTNTNVGWTAGGGAEWMFMSNWSAKIEYLYYDLGSVNYTTYSLRPRNGGSANFLMSTNTSTRFNGNVVRAGVNYHFNFASAPIVAKF